MARRKPRRRDALDDVFEELLNVADATGGADIGREFRSAIHEATARAADALGFPVPEFAQDRGRIPPPSYVPPPGARKGSRYESIGPTHYLVFRIRQVEGRPKAEWKNYHADDPDVTPEQFVDEYLADPSMVGLLVFQGSLLFRDIKHLPGAGAQQEGYGQGP